MVPGTLIEWPVIHDTDVCEGTRNHLAALQHGNGTVIYGDESELKRFERWAQYGRDQAAKARRQRRQCA